MELELDGRRHHVEIRPAGHGWHVTVDGRLLRVDARQVGACWSLLIDPQGEPGSPTNDSAGGPPAVAASYELAVDARGSGTIVVHGGGVAVALSRVQRGRSASPGVAQDEPSGAPQPVLAPLPGRIVRVLVRPGDVVQPRQPLVVIEAMKMENELRAPRGGTVADVRAAEGALVDAKTVLVVIR